MDTTALRALIATMQSVLVPSVAAQSSNRITLASGIEDIADALEAVADLIDNSAWTDYTPTLGVIGTLPTWTSITIVEAKYISFAGTLLLRVHAKGTLGGTVTGFTISTPVAFSGFPGIITAGISTGSSSTHQINGKLMRVDANTLSVDNFESSISPGANRGVLLAAILRI